MKASKRSSGGGRRATVSVALLCLSLVLAELVAWLGHQPQPPILQPRRVLYLVQFNNSREYNRSRTDKVVRKITLFADIPASLRNASISLIQRQAKALVDFDGCGLNYNADSGTKLSRGQWIECCLEWRNFSNVVFPRNDSSHDYRPVFTPPSDHRKGSCYKAPGTLLIVLFNHAYYNNTDFILELYQDVFGGVVFYGPKASNAHRVTGVDVESGYFLHRAIAQAMLDHPSYAGYLWIGDDVFLNYPLAARTIFARPSHIWMTPPWITVDVFNKSQHVDRWLNHTTIGASAVADMCVPRRYVEKMQRLNRHKTWVGKVASDVGYVPRRFAERFVEMAYAFRNLFEEIALPTLLLLVVDNKDTDVMHIPRSAYLWNDRSDMAADKLWSKYNLTFTHPAKFSSTATRRMVEGWLRKSLATFPCQT